MRATIMLDKEAEEELRELKGMEGSSKSEIIREALRELYLKEKRARENLRFFIDLYNKGVVSEDTLFLLLPRKDAENIIIGGKIGKEAAEEAKNIGL